MLTPRTQPREPVPQPAFALCLQCVDGPGVPEIAFEWSTDDAIVHCSSEQQARYVRATIAERLARVGLRLYPDKIRIVYCQDDSRHGSAEHTSFTFLGYTLRVRSARNGRTGGSPPSGGCYEPRPRP
jgi:hypothetical protein